MADPVGPTVSSGAGCIARASSASLLPPAARRRLKGLACAVFLLTWVPGGAALAATTASATHALPAAAGQRCRLTRVTGTTDNRTGMPMTVIAVRHGARDAWCRGPARKVPARTSATIGIAGSNSSGTSLTVTYRLENGDEIRFEAGLRFPLDRGHAACSFVRVVRSASRYECKAELRIHASTKHAVAVFTVARAPKSSAVGSPQFCGSATAINGLTLNRTSLPITLEAEGIGATNAWCQLDTDPVPANSQKTWKVGDAVFGSSVDMTYSVPTPNHTPDFFEFTAHVDFIFGGGGASCAPIEYNAGQPNSGTFKCLTSFTQGFDPQHPSVDFVITP